MIEMHSDLYREAIARRTSIFEVGGEYVTTTTNEQCSGTPRISKNDTHTESSGISGRAVADIRSSATPSVSEQEDVYHIPYSYGNPLINLGANVLVRGIQMLYTPDWKKEQEMAY